MTSGDHSRPGVAPPAPRIRDVDSAACSVADMPPLDLMTMEETARYIRVSLRTLRYWRTTGQAPPGARFGRNVMFDRIAVDEWARARIQRATSKAS